MRQIVFDTETTGLEAAEGHRIIEIGCIEVIDRRVTGRHFHQYLQPDREIDEGAQAVHGISNELLADKPRFGDVVGSFIDFVRGAELIIHNARFDVGFVNHELSRLGGEWGVLTDYCTVTDTLEMARKLHPGQRNSLDALCKRYGIDNSQRELHGALLDATILADVYLAMTGGQVALSLSAEEAAVESNDAPERTAIRRLSSTRPPLPVPKAMEEELAAHEAYLSLLDKEVGGVCLWRTLAGC
ncbi:MAG: DNA polymerase III subunit epsilon [Chromatiales bacterium]|nr:DNA polymerase III subunit epsilon [Chromatiales bacterium]